MWCAEYAISSFSEARCVNVSIFLELTAACTLCETNQNQVNENTFRGLKDVF